MSAEFEFTDAPARPRPRSYPVGPSWLVIFSATLAANVLAGIILMVGTYLYVVRAISKAVKELDRPARVEPR